VIRAGLIAGYLAALLAVDTQVELPGQLVLGALTWIVLLAAAVGGVVLGSHARGAEEAA